MDNSPEAQNNNFDSNTVYSSQDILNNSLAGKDRNLFTRIKRGRGEKPPKKEKPPRRPVNKRKLAIVAIIAVAAIVLAIGIFLSISFFGNQAKNGHSDDANTTNEGEFSDSAGSGGDIFNEHIPEEVAALKPDQTNPDIKAEDYLIAQLEYINALVDNGSITTAADEMESVMSNIEMMPDAFTACQLASARRASLRIQEADIARRKIAGIEIADPALEEANETEEEKEDEGVDEDYTSRIVERMKEAMEECDE